MNTNSASDGHDEVKAKIAFLNEVLETTTQMRKTLAQHYASKGRHQTKLAQVTEGLALDMDDLLHEMNTFDFSTKSWPPNKLADAYNGFLKRFFELCEAWQAVEEECLTISMA